MGAWTSSHTGEGLELLLRVVAGGEAGACSAHHRRDEGSSGGEEHHARVGNAPGGESEAAVDEHAGAVCSKV